VAKRNAKEILTLAGKLAALVAALWAMAVAAADSVIKPHMADAKQRVHIMCEWAKVQNYNTTKICDAIGASCKTLDAQVLVSGGCEEDGK
jgi:hypothetical protein